MSETESLAAFILVGGRGTRLKEGKGKEFKLWPKPLVRTAGLESETLLDMTIAGLREKAGVERFIFLTGKHPETQEDLIQAHIKAFYGKIGDKIRTKVSFISEDVPLGTAGATNLALEKIEDGSVIVSPSDTVFPYGELSKIPVDYRGRESIIWMATSYVQGGEQNIGKLLCDPETGQIKYVLEGDNPSIPTAEQKAGLNALTSGGVLLVNRNFYLKMYSEYLEAYPKKRGKPVSLYGEFIRWLVEKGEPVYSYDVKEPVMDLGRPEALTKFSDG